MPENSNYSETIENKDEVLNEMYELPIAYGLQYKWGTFSMTQEADAFYGLQVASLDTKLTQSQLAEVQADTIFLRPHLILTAPHELPPVSDQQQADVQVLSNFKSGRLKVWASHTETPEKYHQSILSSTIKKARHELTGEFDVSDMTDEELLESITIAKASSVGIMRLSDISSDHAAQMQLSEVLYAAGKSIAEDGLVAAMNLDNERFSTLLRKKAMSQLGTAAFSGAAIGLFVPGESLLVVTAKILAPLGAVALGAQDLFKRKAAFDRSTVGNVIDLMTDWRRIGKQIGEDVQSAYSAGSTNRFIEQMQAKLDSEWPEDPAGSAEPRK